MTTIKIHEVIVFTIILVSVHGKKWKKVVRRVKKRKKKKMEKSEEKKVEKLGKEKGQKQMKCIIKVLAR